MPTEDRHYALRLAAGSAGTFATGLLAGWPFSIIAVVFALLFLQSASGPSMRWLFKTILFGFAVLFSAWCLASLLMPYPLLYLLAISAGIVAAYRWMVLGAGLIEGILALMAVLMVPNLALGSTGLALQLVIWVPINILIAGLVTHVMFAILPAPPPVPEQANAEPQTAFSLHRRILRMSLVTVPFAILFFVFEGSAILALFFIAILGQQLAAMTQAGPTVARTMILANLIGAGFAVIGYEVVVVAPMLLTASMVCFAICLILATAQKSDSVLAPYAGSAMTTAHIIFGGSIAPLSDDADIKGVARVLQVMFATGFVLLAYLVIDALLPEKPERAGEEAA